MALSLGRRFTNVITEHGDIYGFGQNFTGQIGNAHFPDFDSTVSPETMEDRPVLIDFKGKSRPVMMAAGSLHTVCLAQDGSVWTWGSYIYGQTSRAEETEETITQERLHISAFGGNPVVMVACGSYFSVVLTGTGQVWNCGMGYGGELGHGDSESKFAMTLLDPEYFAGNPVTTIAAGYNHTMALCGAENTLYTWGCNIEDDGSLGREKRQTEHEVPFAVASNTFNNTVIISMSVGHDFGVVVTADGAMWACGKNHEGQLGLDDRDDRVFFERVAGSELFGVGGVRMTSCQSEKCMVLSKIGQVWICGQFRLLLPTIMPSTTFFKNAHVVTISCGVYHSALVKSNGQLYTWGEGLFGALGFGNEDFMLLPHRLRLPERVGHNLMMDENRAIRFALGNHARVGANTVYLSASAEVVMLMYTALRFKLPAKTAPGLRILLGFDSETIEHDEDEEDDDEVSEHDDDEVSEHDDDDASEHDDDDASEHDDDDASEHDEDSDDSDVVAHDDDDYDDSDDDDDDDGNNTSKKH